MVAYQVGESPTGKGLVNHSVADFVVLEQQKTREYEVKGVALNLTHSPENIKKEVERNTADTVQNVACDSDRL